MCKDTNTGICVTGSSFNKYPAAYLTFSVRLIGFLQHYANLNMSGPIPTMHTGLNV